MNYDVFISYSSRDENVAKSICDILELNQIKCFIACRDILPGSNWAETLNEAIEQSRTMVLVFSANSNNSAQVAKELNLAVDNNLKILPFRIDNTEPKGSIKYYLSDTQWTDARNEDLENEILKFINIVPQKPNKRILHILLCLLIAICAIGIIVIFFVMSNNKNEVSSSPSDSLGIFEEYKYQLDSAYKLNSDATYALFDIDNNEIPELIICNNTSAYGVYTCANNNLIFCGEVYSKFGIVKHENKLFVCNASQLNVQYQLVWLNEACKVLQSFSPFLKINGQITSDGYTATYFYNQKEISKSEYDKIENSITDISFLPASDLTLLETLK